SFCIPESSVDSEVAKEIESLILVKENLESENRDVSK
ncbi:unnamed protein product, partial [marine sediment metagenome]